MNPVVIALYRRYIILDKEDTTEPNDKFKRHLDFLLNLSDKDFDLYIAIKRGKYE